MEEGKSFFDQHPTSTSLQALETFAQDFANKHSLVSKPSGE
jgi:hypothetical protein